MKRFILPLIVLCVLISNSNPGSNLTNLTVVENEENINTKKTIKINEIKAGTLVRKVEGSADEYELIPQIETDVSVDIQGMISSTIMEQTFINNSDKAIEATYVFPLNHHSAIYDMSFKIDDRIISSVIEEKAEAQKKYTEAKKEGKKVSLLKQERPNMFTQTVANILPNDTIRVEIKYVEPLKYENGEFELRLPLAITPRYTMGGSEIKHAGGVKKISASVEDASSISPPYIPPAIQTAKGVSISIDLDAGFTIQEVSSSHQIIQQKIGDEKMGITLKNDKIIADQDFIFKYKISEKEKPQITTFVSESNGEDYYMILAIPPDPKKNKDQVPKEMTFVLDISGSMNGNNITYAKASLLEALDKLDSKDYFNIIAFDDNTYRFKHNPIPASSGNILEGMNFINNLSGGGGTEALPALAWAMDETHNSDFIKMIFFITDGALGYENEVFKLVDSSLRDARMFSINIGYSPNSFLLEKIAEMSRGSYIYIKNNRDIVDKIGKLMDRINKPIISDIQLKLDDEAELYPTPIKDLYENEPIVIYGKSDDLKNKLTIEGKTGRGKYKETFRIKKRKLKKHASIPILWARKKIESLMNDYRLKYSRNNQTKEDLKNRVIEVSKKYNVLSKFTSFIAIENIVSNNTGELLSGNVPIELPKNWQTRQAPQFDKNQNTKFAHANLPSKYSRGSLPQTGTDNPLYLLWGSILVLSSMILALLKRVIYVKKDV